MSFLEIEFLNEAEYKTEYEDFWLNKTLPFEKSKVFLSSVETVESLTNEDVTRRIYKLTLNLKGIDCDFLPGDTIGIIPPNRENIVNELMIRLNIEKKCDDTCRLKISENVKKKLPGHLPPLATLRKIFRNHVDIEKPPKKLFLKNLIKYTNDEQEIKQLESLSSPKSTEYSEFVTGPGATLIDSLNHFPSLQPPVSLILEHLGPLQPRAFSISSSPLLGKQLDITFSVTGLCTQWLESLKHKKASVPFYFRQSNNFKMSESNETSICMIATGTGIAPFRSFFQHRLLEIKNGNRFASAYLLYGCKTENDYLYKEEIEECLESGALTEKNICFSREGEKIYVQDYIKKNQNKFWQLILENSTFYVCGNKGMLKGVKEAFIEIFEIYGNLDRNSAEEALDDLSKSNRFLIDSWL